jgi:hypothetical protein
MKLIVEPQYVVRTAAFIWNNLFGGMYELMQIYVHHISAIGITY